MIVDKLGHWFCFLTLWCNMVNKRLTGEWNKSRLKLLSSIPTSCYNWCVISDHVIFGEIWKLKIALIIILQFKSHFHFWLTFLFLLVNNNRIQERTSAIHDLRQYSSKEWETSNVWVLHHSTFNHNKNNNRCLYRFY